MGFPLKSCALRLRKSITWFTREIVTSGWRRWIKIIPRASNQRAVRACAWACRRAPDGNFRVVCMFPHNFQLLSPGKSNSALTRLKSWQNWKELVDERFQRSLFGHGRLQTTHCSPFFSRSIHPKTCKILLHTRPSSFALCPSPPGKDGCFSYVLVAIVTDHSFIAQYAKIHTLFINPSHARSQSLAYAITWHYNTQGQSCDIYMDCVLQVAMEHLFCQFTRNLHSNVVPWLSTITQRRRLKW